MSGAIYFLPMLVPISLFIPQFMAEGAIVRNKFPANANIIDFNVQLFRHFSQWKKSSKKTNSSFDLIKKTKYSIISGKNRPNKRKNSIKT